MGDEFVEETTSDGSSDQTGPDSYVEEKTTGWGSRIINSLVGILVGIALVIGAGFLLFWNEGRTVKTTLGLKEAAGVLVSTDSNAVNPGNNNKLVHVTGEMATPEMLKDPDFGVAINAIALKRIVEIYQWQEKSKTEETKNLGGSKTERTTYTYEKSWSTNPISSSSFKQPQGHTNPAQVPYIGQSSIANNVTLGKFTLSRSLVSQLNNFEPLPLDTAFQQQLPLPVRNKSQIAGEWCYLGDPQNPKVGDERVKFTAVRSGPVSVISRQFGNSFTPFVAQSGKNIEMISPGIVGADVMFGEARSENMMLAWVLRGVGTLLMFIAILLILKPISVVLDVLPFLGSIAGVGIGITALAVSLVLSAVVVAVAWMSYRPLISVGIIVAAVAVAVLLRFTRKPNPARA